MKISFGKSGKSGKFAKFGLIVAASALIFLCAAKAPASSGQVPDLAPLQPLPDLIKPDVEHNVSGNAEGGGNDIDIGGDEATPANLNQNAQPDSATAENTAAPAAANVVDQTAPAPLSGRTQNFMLWIVVIGLVIAAVLVILGLRHHYKNKK